jgi:hypothetical protein
VMIEKKKKGLEPNHPWRKRRETWGGSTRPSERQVSIHIDSRYRSTDGGARNSIVMQIYKDVIPTESGLFVVFKSLTASPAFGDHPLASFDVVVL